MKKLLLSLVVISLLLPTIASSAGKLAIFTKQSYNTATNITAKYQLQQLTPLLDWYGVNYKIYDMSTMGTTAAAAIDSICDDLDDVDGITVGLWLGGNQDDESVSGSSGPWVADILYPTGTASPDYPMVWATTDFKMYFNCETGAEFPANSGVTDNHVSGDGITETIGTAVSATVNQNLNTAQTFGDLDVLAYSEADTSDMFTWRIGAGGAFAPHVNGWSFLNVPQLSAASFSYPGKVEFGDHWWSYNVLAECVYWDSSIILKPGPIYWNIQIDDELHSAATSDSLPYGGGATRWKDESNLQILADSLDSWDMKIGMGVNPDSINTTEGLAKRAIYNNPQYTDNFYIAWHSHGTPVEDNTTVATMLAAGTTARDSLASAFPSYSINDFWSTGFSFGPNFYTVMTPDSVSVALGGAGFRYIRGPSGVRGHTPAHDDNANPRMNNYLSTMVGDYEVNWYPFSSQVPTDTTAATVSGSSYHVSAPEFNLMSEWSLFYNAQLKRWVAVNHVPSFSGSRPGLIWLERLKSMRDHTNSNAGVTLIEFGDTEQMMLNFKKNYRSVRGD